MGTISAFTKPWASQSLEEIAELLQRLGFDGVEYCLRPGYQVEPADAESGLQRVKEVMGLHQIALTSVAGPLDERAFAAYAHSRVPFVRTLVPLELDGGFDRAQKVGEQFIESFLPLAEQYKVVVGLQLHTNSLANSTFELYRIVKRYDSPYLRAVWDSAHSAIAGEKPEQSLPLLSPLLCSINLKNVVYSRVDEVSGVVQWRSQIVCGRRGICSWPSVVSLLKEMGYSKNITVAHEYDDQLHLTDQLADDRSLLSSLLDTR